MKSYRELLGGHMRELCFVIGPGPSIQKAQKWLMKPIQSVFRIAINAAIEKVPCEYWFWLDLASYQFSKDHPNAKNAIKIGPEDWKEYYEEDVHTCELARKLPEDVQNLKLLHRGTSLVGAINLGALLGSPRIVTVGCDHTFDDSYLKYKHEEANRGKPASEHVTLAQIKDFYNCTKLRINKGLAEMPFWLPHWCSVRDASGGDLPLIDTSVRGELEMVERFRRHCEERKAKEAVAK